MKFIKVFLLFSLVLFFGCSDSPLTNNSQQINFSIHAWDYSESHYIPDTLYKSSFLDYHNNTSGIFLPSTADNIIIDSLVEIWVQTILTDPKKRVASAILLLPQKPVNGYPDSLFRPDVILGKKFFGVFRKLYANEYLINPVTGLISFRIDLPEIFTAGITYKTKSNKQYGVGSGDLPSYNDTMLLKMFKVGNMGPAIAPLAWELKMKNIYRLPVSEVTNDSFFLDIYFKENDNYSRTYPGSGIPLLRMLQLDKYVGNTRIPPPDGIFDFLTGYTIIPLTGDIIFPSLYPFKDKIPDVNYKFEEIYTQGKDAASNSPKAQYYHIRGFAKSSY